MASLTRPNGPNSIFNSTIRIIQNATSKLQETARAFFGERRVGKAPSPSVVMNNQIEIQKESFTDTPKNTSDVREISSITIAMNEELCSNRNSSSASHSIKLHNLEGSVSTYTVQEYKENLKTLTNKDDIPHVGRAPFSHSINSLLKEKLRPALYGQIGIDIRTIEGLKRRLGEIGDDNDRANCNKLLSEMLEKLNMANELLTDYHDYTDSCQRIVKPILEKWVTFTRAVKEAEASGEIQSVDEIAMKHINAVADARSKYVDAINLAAKDWTRGNLEGLEAYLNAARNNKLRVTSAISSIAEIHLDAGKLIRAVTSRLNSPIVQTTPQVTM